MTHPVPAGAVLDCGLRRRSSRGSPRAARGIPCFEAYATYSHTMAALRGPEPSARIPGRVAEGGPKPGVSEPAGPRMPGTADVMPSGEAPAGGHIRRTPDGCRQRRKLAEPRQGRGLVGRGGWWAGADPARAGMGTGRPDRASGGTRSCVKRGRAVGGAAYPCPGTSPRRWTGVCGR